MALTGHLSDLSLSELLEFFCNQRKSGRLKVLYPKGAGYFFLHAGSVVDARIGVLQGIDAVFFALTLPNAQFEFSAEAESVNRTINQPWTQVVLEGLRRLDEGIPPGVAFPEGYVPEPDELEEQSAKNQQVGESHRSFAPAFFAFAGKDSSRRKPLFIGAIAVAVLASVAVIGVPAGWYGKPKPAAPAETATTAPSQPAPAETTPAQPEPEANSQSEDAAALAARRQRERERKAREAKATAGESSSVSSSPSEASKPGPKKVVVTVTYDESGRVVQASGGDPTALRIARQKRFPAGKAGSATVTIPIN
jgi:hypothetical protein